MYHEEDEDDERFDLFGYANEHVLVPFAGVIMYAVLIALIFSMRT